MNSEVVHSQKSLIEAGSAYLNKPLRTLEQAKADIEAARKADKREGR